MHELLQIGQAATEREKRDDELTSEELALMTASIEEKMLQAAANLDFELAAKLRDRLFELRGEKKTEIDKPQQRKRARRMKR